ncbi:bifunctional UDP-N-acetylglucosamine pyrophosphorylase/glucosamine-1-phosphate N-acetyltransferase [Methanococcus voltae]|uniref:bifunctional sugar-1-phosphate nucleotidylyltransferase/acetyltransferase n=1 Tax=Methanococcus voltae TaxID=2188 RepID=UPI001AE50847|nr:bifunctional sugar-1-phosphate nucleotidylyltransferase/acetyltransferase [Methanococcus voltae]MBP2143463.1 bifunctional UDP-N-acetylglucosamine pyrophosphorylase/glucosamine-1-phosphate N-acetyltransferase [Methanococcus voltae]
MSKQENQEKNISNNLDALILCAGKGTRLRPLTDNTPKPMIPIAGKPIVAHLVDKVKDFVDNIYILVGYQKEAIIEYFNQNNNYNDYAINFIEQTEQLGTGHAVLMLKEYLDKNGTYENLNDFLVINGDIVFEDNLDGFLNKNLENDMDNSKNYIGALEVSNPENFGVIVTDSKNNILKIVEKPSREELPSLNSNLVNAGIYRFKKDVFDILKNLKPSSRNEIELPDAIDELIKKQQIKAITIKGYWDDIGRPWDVLKANKELLAHIKSDIKGEIQQNVVIVGNVVIEEGAVIRPNTVIEGPTIIKKGADIGPLAHIRPYTVLMENTHAGNSSEIKNSLIMEGSKIPHLSYVGDSIVGKNCNFGCNTITANLRFDDKPPKVNIKGVPTISTRKMGTIMGDNVKTGIQVSFMPGVKVGSNSWIGANSIIDRDVENDTIVFTKQEIEVVKKKK